jgi:hypothetical protein
MIAPNSGIASFLAPDRSKLTVPIDELSRSKPRPIELIDSPRCHLSQISARWAAE